MNNVNILNLFGVFAAIAVSELYLSAVRKVHNFKLKNILGLQWLTVLIFVRLILLTEAENPKKKIMNIFKYQQIFESFSSTISQIFQEYMIVSNFYLIRCNYFYVFYIYS